ncbi:MAG TPA: LamG-like jellyroll fold domain-containing protein [Capsulimonadaceae bacterium]|jgi:hypothetical protein
MVHTIVIRIAAVAFVFASLTRAAVAAPVVLWASDPVAPGQTVLVFGDGFDGCKSVHWERIPDKPGGRAYMGDVAPVQVRQKSVKFVLPATVPQGVFRATIRVGASSATVVVNRPQVLWAQGNAGSSATQGGFVRVVGKCLALPGKKAVIRLSASGHDTNVAPTRSEPFTAQAPLPSSLPAGTYSLTVSSAGNAWSEPVSFVVAPRPRPVPVVLTAPEPDSNATANVTAIQALLTKAGETGGVVRLPAGRWGLDDGLTVPRNVTLEGAGMDRTALCWKDSDTPPKALIAGTDHFAVRDLSLYAINYIHGIIADQSTPTAGSVAIERVRMRINPYRGHLTLDEVNKRFTAAMKHSSGGGDSLRLGGENITVAGCDIYGAGRCLYLSRASGAWVHDNTFYNGRWGWYCLSGNNGVIFENNSVIGGDLMSTGGGLNCLDGSTCSQNVYYAGNTLRNMFGWDREAMTTDAGGAAYYGLLKSGTANTVTLPVDVTWTRNWTGAGIFVLNGTGQGQYRQIAKTAGRDVTVDKPWQIVPDATSIISITMLQRNYLFVGNSFTDAGVAIQMYGMAVGNIASGNTTARTDGYHNFGMNYHGVQPSWYIQWLDNRITDGTVYSGGHDQSVWMDEAHLAVQALDTRVTPLAPVTLCAIVRGNKLDDSAHIEIGTGNHAEVPLTEEVVVEQNVVKNALYGLKVARMTAGVYSRENTFINCGQGEIQQADIEAKAGVKRAALFAKPGPLMRFTFDKPAPFADTTGNGFKAAAAGKVATEPGAHGGSLVLDGLSYVTVDHPELIEMPSFTVSLWIAPQRISGRWGLVSKRVNNAPAPFVIAVHDGCVLFEAADPSGQWPFNTRTAPVLAIGRWTHVAVVFEAGKGATVYIDGKPAARTVSTLSVAQNDEPLIIGRDAWGGPNAGNRPEDKITQAIYQGKLADVQLWPRALGAAEVAKLAAP